MNLNRTKYILIVSFVTTSVTFVTLFSIWYFNSLQTQRQLERIKGFFELSQLIHLMSDSARQRALLVQRMLYTDDIFDRYEIRDQFYSLGETFIQARNKLTSHPIFDDYDQQLWDKTKGKISAAGNFYNAVINLLMQNQNEKAYELFAKNNNDIQNDFVKNLNEFIMQEDAEANKVIKMAAERNSKFLYLLILSGLVGIFIFIAISIYSYSTINKAENIMLEANKKEEDINKFKTQFLSNVSHELRSPLNSILGFTQVLGMNKEDDLPDKYQTYFKHIENAGWQLLSIVDGIDDLSNISRGRYELTIAPLDLDKALSVKLSSFENIANSYQVKCSYDVSALENNTIFTDEKHFNKIMDNLLTNAIEHNTKSGTVKITASPLPDNIILIEVENTGPGIQKDEIGLMFRPYARISKYRANEVAGIGLVFVKELVELMGGEVGVHSEPNIKTTFWFTLPNKFTT